MRKQIPKLRPIPRNLIIGQRQPRQLRNIPNINRIRSHSPKSFEKPLLEPAPTKAAPSHMP